MTVKALNVLSVQNKWWSSKKGESVPRKRISLCSREEELKM